jgi:hypothetical protein
MGTVMVGSTEVGVVTVLSPPPPHATKLKERISDKENVLSSVMVFNP